MKTLPASREISLAVTPLLNHSGKKEFDYFSIGLADEMIVDLSHFSGLRIISSYTSNLLAINGNDLEAAEKLNIDYLLKGSLYINSNNLKLNMQLIDTLRGAIIWAEKFNAAVDELFDVQENIVQRVVFTIAAEVELNILAAARKKPKTSLEAYDWLLRGMDNLRKGTLEADKEARNCFNQALAIDPYYSRAYGGLSLSHFNEWSCQLWELYETSAQNAYKYAVKAFELDDSDHLIHMILGRIYIYRREFDHAEHHIEKSVALNSNDADALVQLASCMALLGRAVRGEELFLKALKLNPYRNLWYYQYGSFIYFVLRQFEKSIELAHKRQLTNIWVDLPGYIAAAHAHLGNSDSARKYVNLFKESFIQSISKGNPHDTKKILDWVRLANPFRYQEDTDCIIEGLLLAGLEDLHLQPALQQRVPSIPIADSDPSPAIFKQEEGVWRMEYETLEVILPDLKGYHDIATLLDNQDKDIHCSVLVRGCEV